MIIAIVIGVSCLFWIIAAILFVCAKGVDRRISESEKDCVEKTTATGDKEKVKVLEKKLAQIEGQLSQKDNDTYRRQNAVIS